MLQYFNCLPAACIEPGLIPACHFFAGIVFFTVVNIRFQNGTVGRFPVFIGDNCFACSIRIIHFQLNKERQLVAIISFIPLPSDIATIPAIAHHCTYRIVFLQHGGYIIHLVLYAIFIACKTGSKKLIAHFLSINKQLVQTERGYIHPC